MSSLICQFCCGKQFKSVRELVAHLETVPLYVDCPFCPLRNLGGPKKLAQHLKETHVEDEKPSAAASRNKRAVVVLHQQQAPSTVLLNQEVVHQEVAHQEVVSAVQSVMEPLPTMEVVVEEVIEAEEGDFFICTSCGLKVADIEAHLRTAHPTQEMRVLEITKVAERETLEATEKKTEWGISPSLQKGTQNKQQSEFVCRTCWASFPQRLDLYHHYKVCCKTPGSRASGATASGSNEAVPQGKFICNECGHMYNRSYRKMHMLMHQGNTSFTCPVCHKGFFSRSNLNHHLKMHAANAASTDVLAISTTDPIEDAVEDRV